MTTKAGMLPGDDFSLAEWSAARNLPKSLPADLPADVQTAYKTLLHACQRHQVPHFAVFVVEGGISTQYDLLDKPENVPQDVLTARATTCGDLAHQMGLMGIALQGMDLSKLKGL